METFLAISPGPGPYFPARGFPGPMASSSQPSVSIPNPWFMGPALQTILSPFGISNRMCGLDAILELHNRFRSNLANIALGNRLRCNRMQAQVQIQAVKN